MKTLITMCFALLAGLMLLAASCDKSAKATDSANSGDPAVNTIAASDMNMQDENAEAGTNEPAGHDHGAEAAGTDMDMQADADVTKSTSPATGHPYPLSTCPISGEELGSMGDPIHLASGGRDVALCCKGCIKKFEAEPAKYFAEIDAKIIEAQLPNYPMTTCPVSGEALAEGSTIDKVVDNRLVRFCCEDCVATFEADPAAYFAKLDDAVIAAQSASYPMTTCPVSGDTLVEGSTINYVVGTTLVKLCCDDCKNNVNAHPAKYLKQIADAEAAKSA
jgi:YHS domain-containing protein